MTATATSEEKKLGYDPENTYVVYFKPETERLPHHFPKDETQRQRLERLWGEDILDIRGADEPPPRKTGKSTAADVLLNKNKELRQEVSEKDKMIADLKAQLTKNGSASKKKEEPKSNVAPEAPEGETLLQACKRLQDGGMSLAKIAEEIGITISQVRTNLSKLS